MGIELNDLQRCKYTTVLDGNDGEEQLIITVSVGQSGMCAVFITSASVDGGGECIYSRDQFNPLELRLAKEAIEMVLTVWAGNDDILQDARVSSYLQCFDLVKGEF